MKNTRKNKAAGSLYQIIIPSGVLLYLLLNILASLLAGRFPGLSPDLTRNKAFRLSAQTIENVKQLEAPVEIQVLAKEETFAGNSAYNAQANEIFRQFEKASPQIRLTYIDYTKDPAFASRYPELALKHGDILVLSEERYKLVQTEELFNYLVGANGQVSILSSRAEEAVGAAIALVSGGSQSLAVITTGHGESRFPGFEELLQVNNYEMVYQNLITQTIPEETAIITILAPNTDFSPEELERLDSFLYNNGDYGKVIFYCGDAEQPALENLEAFLREWGIQVLDGAVFETDETRVYNSHPFYAIADYGEETYAGMLRNENVPMLAPVAKPLNILFDVYNNYHTALLLEFAPSAGVRPSEATQGFTADDAQIWGPLPALVLSSYQVTDRQTGLAGKSSYVLVSASAKMLDEYALGTAAFANREYLLHLIGELTGRESALLVQPKSLAGTALALSKNQADMLGMFFSVTIPAVTLIVGLLIWIRRRKL